MCIEGNFIILCPRLTLQTFAKIQIDWQDLLRESMVSGGKQTNAGDFGLGTNQNYTELIPTLNLICNSAQNRSYLLNLNLVRHKKEVRPLLFCIT